MIEFARDRRRTTIPRHGEETFNTMRAEEFLLQTGCVKWFKSGEEEKEKREKFRRLLPREGVTYQKRSTVIFSVSKSGYRGGGRVNL